jgi:hypothetical protein
LDEPEEAVRRYPTADCFSPPSGALGRGQALCRPPRGEALTPASVATIPRRFRSHRLESSGSKAACSAMNV